MMRHFAIVLVAAMLIGCAARRAQTGVQAALTSVAEAVAATDRIVAAGVPQAGEEARSAVRARIRAGENIDGLEAYRAAMRPWYEAGTALEAARQALVAAQGGVTIWIESGRLPDGWPGLCAAVAQSLDALVALIEVLGVDVPDEVTAAQPLVEPACSMASSFVGGE